MNDRTQPPGTAPMDVVSDPGPRQRMRRLRKHLLPLQSESISPIDLPSVRTGLLTKLNALTVGLIALTGACDLRLLLLAAVGQRRQRAAPARPHDRGSLRGAIGVRRLHRGPRVARAHARKPRPRSRRGVRDRAGSKARSDHRATLLTLAWQRADPGAARELRCSDAGPDDRARADDRRPALSRTGRTGRSTANRPFARNRGGRRREHPRGRKSKTRSPIGYLRLACLVRAAARRDGSAGARHADRRAAAHRRCSDRVAAGDEAAGRADAPPDARGARRRRRAARRLRAGLDRRRARAC